MESFGKLEEVSGELGQCPRKTKKTQEKFISTLNEKNRKKI